MTAIRTGGWLLGLLAIVGLVFAVPVVSAHGNETAADDTSPYNGTAEEEWTAWMESHMGVTVEEMGRDMADDGRMTGYGGC
jgi:hypothetical protein